MLSSRLKRVGPLGYAIFDLMSAACIPLCDLGIILWAFTNVNNIANPRQPTENTPESYAWAALAVYLARNGAKMDYSTGLARPMGEPLASPAPGKLKRDETLVAQNFTA